MDTTQAAARWREAFILELRLLDIPGARIGDAWAEVETHCQETGEDPGEAFGDAASYARTLAAELPASGDARRLRLLAGGIGLGCLLGTGATLGAVEALGAGERVAVGWGELVGAVVLGAALGLAAPALTALLRPGRSWLLGVGLALALVVSVLATLAVPGTAVTLPAVPTLVVGILVLVATGLVLHRLQASDADLLLDPRTDQVATVPRWVPLVTLGLPLVVLVGAALALLLV